MRPRHALLAVLLLGLAACGPQPADSAASGASATPTTADAAAVPDCADESDERGVDALEVEPVVARAEAYLAGGGADHAAGLWLEHGPAGPRVMVALTGDIEAHEAALRDGLEEPALLEVVPVRYTTAELSALEERIAADEPDLGRATASGSFVDPQENRVVLMVVAVDDAARATLADAYPADMLCIEPLDGPATDAPPGGGADDVVAVPTSPPAGFTEEALLEGVLAADAESQCLWLEAGSKQVTIVWPAGYGARFTPDGAELVDDEGEVAAREGDRIGMAGPNSDTPPDRCHVGDSVWSAGSVGPAEQSGG